jgi:hypothetical protein
MINASQHERPDFRSKNSCERYSVSNFAILHRQKKSSAMTAKST